MESDNLNQAQRKVQTIMEGSEHSEKLPSIFAHLNLLVTYLQRFDVKRKVYVNPLSSLNDKFFAGNVLFQCVFDGSRRDVFAAGGRYDQLIQEFYPKVLSNRSQAHAVGFNLSWDRLSSLVLLELRSPNKAALKGPEETGMNWRTRRVSKEKSILVSVRLTFFFPPFDSVTFSLPVSMPRYCGLWVSTSFEICGRMVSAPNSLSTPHRSKNSCQSTEMTIIAG